VITDVLPCGTRISVRYPCSKNKAQSFSKSLSLLCFDKLRIAIDKLSIAIEKLSMVIGNLNMFGIFSLCSFVLKSFWFPVYISLGTGKISRSLSLLCFDKLSIAIDKLSIAIDKLIIAIDWLNMTFNQNFY
jgi:hypothetical protein